ncbi:helix-turn-helix domain-containing protein [Nonomuraea basaltis]|uniref:helix-turn-helix domain-containing protein n=1 Tax=Nonomuraea basaltis TaxID=2495887 RepID=UPI00110C602D|nr:helix-turn-helix domain-containing protein [Nonomuraea basaltis]TMR98424.1 helix-turn-helix domain-containing protein [Nonomuraea basaltis]
MTTARTRPGEGIQALPTAAPPAGAELDDAAILGRRIRQLRKNAGLTLDRVADAAQISASLLSRIERGAAQPSLPTLRTISQALGIPIAALFEGEDRSTASEHDAAGRRLVVRHADRRRLKVPDSRIQYELMIPDLDGAVEVIWGAIPRGGGTTHPSSHPGEEVIVALAGHVAVVVDDQEFLLAGGDTIRFDRSRPHRLFNPRPTVAEFVLVVTPPSR